MTGFEGVQIVALTGWLAVAIGAFASYRLSWKKSLQLIFIWTFIFGTLTLLISMIMR